MCSYGIIEGFLQYFIPLFVNSLDLLHQLFEFQTNLENKWYQKANKL